MFKVYRALATHQILNNTNISNLTFVDRSHCNGLEAEGCRKQEIRERKIKEYGLTIPDLSSARGLVKDVPITCGILADTEVEITKSSPSIILKKIADRIWSTEDFLKAFITTACVAHYLTNPLTEIFFEKGLERARDLHRILSDTGKLVGPSHGLPISLKDTLHIKGVESTTGYVAWIGNIQSKDDSLVKMLSEAGAVFYCKTNAPQTLMSGECVNFIFGRTSTPWNTKLSAGGSSGGEASLISLGGSPLGIGSDIAGSIRTPANFNGTYGLCPSSGRFPGHSASALSGDRFISPVYGPLSSRLQKTEFTMGNSTTQYEFSSIYSTLRETFGTGRTKSLKWRKFQLKQLFWLLQDNEQALVDSLSADLHRHEFESLMSDIDETKITILEALKHVEEWSRGQAPSDAGFIYGTLGKAWIRKEPQGTVLIIGAWSYPISTLLTVGVAAIAAGNSVIFKPSEMAPVTEQLLATLIPKYMDTSAISIVRANPNQMALVLEHQFDFMFYTGSTRVGRIIAAVAAKHVTPSALELGGQAPAIVT